MAHFHIDIVIDAKDIKILKENFRDYCEESGGFTVKCIPDNEVEDSRDVEDVLKRIFLELVRILYLGNFKGIH